MSILEKKGLISAEEIKDAVKEGLAQLAIQKLDPERARAAKRVLEGDNVN